LADVSSKKRRYPSPDCFHKQVFLLSDDLTRLLATILYHPNEKRGEKTCLQKSSLRIRHDQTPVGRLLLIGEKNLFVPSYRRKKIWVVSPKNCFKRGDLGGPSGTRATREYFSMNEPASHFRFLRRDTFPTAVWKVLEKSPTQDHLLFGASKTSG